MKLALRGHSGCSLEIIFINDVPCVCKSTSDRSYFKRLASQAKKQSAFYLLSKNYTGINVPRIYKSEQTEARFSFYMAYHNYKDYITFFQTADKDEIDSLIGKICSFITKNIAESDITDLSPDVFVAKLNEIKSKLKQAPERELLFRDIFIRVHEFLDSRKWPLKIPVGPCHGDLTFSNILFNKNSMVFIDFLDSFVESPLQDIVKLRQDARYLWSINFYDGNFDRVKIKIVMHYVDNLICDFFSGYDFYRDYYPLFQLINFLRIVPYAREQDILVYLKTTINRILEEIEE